jgi:hypothetical protein
MAEVIETRKPPASPAETAHELAVLVGHIEAITSGDASADLIVDRMIEAGADERSAAFEGITYAWILAVSPHLHGIVRFEDNPRSSERPTLLVVGEFSWPLPAIFTEVDQEWRLRPSLSRSLSLVTKS